MDPAEIRRINFMQPETFPRTTITGGAYDSGEYEKALDAALEASGYSGPARSRRHDEPRATRSNSASAFRPTSR